MKRAFREPSVILKSAPNENASRGAFKHFESACESMLVTTVRVQTRGKIGRTHVDFNSNSNLSTVKQAHEIRRGSFGLGLMDSSRIKLQFKRLCQSVLYVFKKLKGVFSSTEFQK